ncbi:MAG: hypothetical protein ACLRWQ_09550 [Flavonifractor plautii]
MVGIVALEERRGRRPVVTEERVLGLRCLRVSVPVRPGLREDRRKRRAEQGGGGPVPCRGTAGADGGGFSRLARAGGTGAAECGPGALLPGYRRPPGPGRAPAGGHTAGAGHCGPVRPRVSRPLFAAAERLCPQVRHLVVDVPGEGEELAAWLGGGGAAALLARRGGPA